MRPRIGFWLWLLLTLAAWAQPPVPDVQVRLRVPLSGEQPDQVGLSPNGRWLALGQALPPAIKLYDLSEASPQARTVACPDTELTALAVDSRGSLLVITDYGRSAYRIPLGRAAQPLADNGSDLRYTVPIWLGCDSQDRFWVRGYYQGRHPEHKNELLLTLPAEARRFEARYKLSELASSLSEQGPVVGMALAPDGGWLVLLCESGQTSSLWATAVGRPPERLDSGEAFGPVHPALEFGQAAYLKWTGETANLTLSGPEGPKSLREWRGYEAFLSPDGHQLTTIGGDPARLHVGQAPEFALEGRRIPGWKGRLLQFQVSQDGSAFCLLSDSEVLVGGLKP